MRSILSTILLSIFTTTTIINAQGNNYYIAKISTKDHYNKRGNKLTKVADILQQDRANFYKYGIRDSEDRADNYFFTKENRFRIRKMLENGYISGDTVYQIINGTPVIKVEIHKKYGYINVYIESSDKSLQSKRKVILSKSEKIALLRQLLKSKSRNLNKYGKHTILSALKHKCTNYRNKDEEVKYFFDCREKSSEHYHCKFTELSTDFEDEGSITIQFDYLQHGGLFKIKRVYPVDLAD